MPTPDANTSTTTTTAAAAASVESPPPSFGVIYSFCVIEASNAGVRSRAVQLVARLLHAGFTLQSSAYYTTLVPLPHHPTQPAPQPLAKHTAIYTLVRAPTPAKEVFDQAVIDQEIATAKQDLQSGQLEIQIA